MNLSTLQKPRVPKAYRRLGRGAGSGRGTTGGRGTKGQRARTGGRGGLKLMGLKVTVLKLPKLGGFTSRWPKMQAVNLGDISAKFAEGEVVNGRNLVAKGLISRADGPIKILGQGTLTKKVKIIVDAVSASAKQAIEKSGSSVEFIVHPGSQPKIKGPGRIAKAKADAAKKV